jgi:plastocyanin
MERIGVGVGIIVLTLALAGPAAAYDAMAVSDGGTISGTITYGGAPPAAKTIKATKDTEACGATIPDEALMVDAGKGIKNVVVRITDIKKGKKWEAKPVLDQKKCHFQPHVLVVQAAQDMKILNSDGILHNIHTFSTKNAAFNIAMPKFRKKLERTFAVPEIIRVACDAHAWMSGWIVVSESPYAVVTDADGNFKLENVPPGNYKVEVWHEKLGKVVKDVTVKAKEESKLGVELALK